MNQTGAKGFTVLAAVRPFCRYEAVVQRSMCRLTRTAAHRYCRQWKPEQESEAAAIAGMYAMAGFTGIMLKIGCKVHQYGLYSQRIGMKRIG